MQYSEGVPLLQISGTSHAYGTTRPSISGRSHTNMSNQTKPDAVATTSEAGSIPSRKSIGNEQLLTANHNDHAIPMEYVLDTKQSCLQPKHFVYLCTSLACLSSILLGYDIGIMSGAIVYMDRDLELSQLRKEVIISSLNLFSIVGALFGGHISQSIGRKKTISISAVIFLFGLLFLSKYIFPLFLTHSVYVPFSLNLIHFDVNVPSINISNWNDLLGAALIAATRQFAAIVCGRVLLGIACGTGLLIAPLYTAELAPSHIRGKLVTFTEICIYIGILFGYFIAWCFNGTKDDDLAWRLMISFGVIPAVILFVSMLMMPESPRWLIEHGMDNEAFNVLHNVYGDNKQLIRIEMNEIRNTIKMENQKHRIQQMTSSKTVGKVDADGGSAWSQWKEVLFPSNEYIKRALLIGIGVSFFQQASGNEAAVYYTPHIFRAAGVEEDQILLYTMFVGAAKTSVVIVSAFSLDKLGRRPLLLASSGCTTVALLGLALAFWMDSYILTVIFQCLFQGSVSIGWGPITWVLISEIFPMQIRSKAMAICTTVNRLVSGTVALTFLSLQSAITPHGTWLMFAGISAISMVFIFKFVPETKQKTLEEITKFLMRSYSKQGNKKRHSSTGDIGLDQRGSLLIL